MLHFPFSCAAGRVNFTLTASSETHTLSNGGLVKAKSGFLFPIHTTVAGFSWTGDLPPQKWTNFYMKVLSKFATGDGVKLTVTVDVAPPCGVSKSRLEETRVALRELGLSEGVKDRGN
jgi:hypothetical protein